MLIVVVGLFLAIQRPVTNVWLGTKEQELQISLKFWVKDKAKQNNQKPGQSFLCQGFDTFEDLL